MGRDGSKKLKVAQIKPLRSGTLGCSHTCRAEARKTGRLAPFGDGKLPHCGAFDALSGASWASGGRTPNGAVRAFAGPACYTLDIQDQNRARRLRRSCHALCRWSQIERPFRPRRRRCRRRARRRPQGQARSAVCDDHVRSPSEPARGCETSSGWSCSEGWQLIVLSQFQGRGSISATWSARFQG